jgi:hypothetical protein
MKYAPPQAQEGTTKPTQLSFFNRQTGSNAVVQTKLTVGSANYAHEHEANQMADMVMRKPDNSRTEVRDNTITPLIQRACAHCEQEKEQTAQRKETSAATGGFTAPPSVSQAISRSGQGLDSNAKTFMESRFNRSFDNVQVHTDGESAASARDISARAYTSGNHIVFGEGQYQPNTEGGRHLLAHELTHVVQQGENDVIRRSSPDEKPIDQSVKKAIEEPPLANDKDIDTTMVKSNWFIDYNRIPKSKTGKDLLDRKLSTSLNTVLSIFPNGQTATISAGGEAKEPSGKSFLSAQNIPKDKDGKISGIVEFKEKEKVFDKRIFGSSAYEKPNNEETFYDVYLDFGANQVKTQSETTIRVSDSTGTSNTEAQNATASASATETTKQTTMTEEAIELAIQTALSESVSNEKTVMEQLVKGGSVTGKGQVKGTVGAELGAVLKAKTGAIEGLVGEAEVSGSGKVKTELEVTGGLEAQLKADKTNSTSEKIAKQMAKQFSASRKTSGKASISSEMSKAVQKSYAITFSKSATENASKTKEQTTKYSNENISYQIGNPVLKVDKQK